MCKIGFVILSYKNSIDTIDCINSIDKCVKNEYQIIKILVDNSEDDKYLNDILCNANVDFSICCENKGYSHGNNIGIRKAKDEHCDYICVINNDTVVDEFFIVNLFDNFNNYRKVGIIAPLIFGFYDNKIWSSGGKFDPFLFKYRTLSNNINKIKKSTFINGCCICFKSSLIDELGYFNEDYFMYSEDTDFCHKLKKNKYNNYVIPSSFIYHKVSRSSGVGSPFSIYYLYRNKLLFIRKNFSGLLKYYGLFINRLQIYYRRFKFKIKKNYECVKAINYALKDSKKSGRMRY